MPLIETALPRLGSLHRGLGKHCAKLEARLADNSAWSSAGVKKQTSLSSKETSEEGEYEKTSFK